MASMDEASLSICCKKTSLTLMIRERKMKDRISYRTPKRKKKTCPGGAAAGGGGLVEFTFRSDVSPRKFSVKHGRR